MAATETFSWIPSALILTMYTNDRDLTSILYKVLYTVLIPFNITDDMLRTKRLLLFTSQLGEKSHRALQTLPLRQLQGEQYVLAYLDAAEKLNGGEIAENKDDVTRRFDAVCTSVAALLGMPESSAQRKADLKKWGEQNDRRGFKLFRDLIDPEKDFKTIRKTQVNLFKKFIYCRKSYYPESRKPRHPSPQYLPRLFNNVHSNYGTKQRWNVSSWHYQT